MTHSKVYKVRTFTQNYGTNDIEQWLNSFVGSVKIESVIHRYEQITIIISINH